MKLLKLIYEQLLLYAYFHLWLVFGHIINTLFCVNPLRNSGRKIKMSEYKVLCGVEKEDLVDSISNAMDKAIRENGLSSYTEIQEIIEQVLTVHEEKNE